MSTSLLSDSVKDAQNNWIDAKKEASLLLWCILSVYRVYMAMLW